MGIPPYRPLADPFQAASQTPESADSCTLSAHPPIQAPIGWVAGGRCRPIGIVAHEHATQRPPTLVVLSSSSSSSSPSSSTPSPLKSFHPLPSLPPLKALHP